MSSGDNPKGAEPETIDPYQERQDATAKRIAEKGYYPIVRPAGWRERASEIGRLKAEVTDLRRAIEGSAGTSEPQPLRVNGPDAGGLYWLHIGQYAMFNLGKLEGLAGKQALAALATPEGAGTPLKNAAEQFIAAHADGKAGDLLDYFDSIFREALGKP